MNLKDLRAWFHSYCSFVLAIRPVLPVFLEDPTDREIGFFFYGLAVGVLLSFVLVLGFRAGR